MSLEKKSALRIHRFLSFSRANGPGVRAVIWVQGCSLGCQGCHNPGTHSFSGGELLMPEELFGRILKIRENIEGITVSGGEPLQQIKPLNAFLSLVRSRTKLSVIIFTGYTWEEARRMKEFTRLIKNTDLLIAGRYEKAKRLVRDLKGSSNKTIHFLTDRYSEKDLGKIPVSEVIIEKDGKVILTGIDPVRLNGNIL